MDDPIFGFNEQDKNNLIRILGNSETGGVSGGNGHNDYDATRLILAVATTGIPARSGTTLGKATVAVKHLVTSSGNKVITDSGVNMEGYNLADAAVGTGSYILMCRMGDAGIVIWEQCVA